MLFSSNLFSLALLLSSLFSFTTATNCTSDKKIIYYYGTVSEHGKHISLLPLIDNSTGGVVTNIYVATFGLNTSGLFLNEQPLNHTANNKLWTDMKQLQSHGIKVQAMLLNQWALFHTNDSLFESSYKTLSEGIKAHNFDGIDLDIEDALNNPNPIGLNATIKLIDRIREDFGPDFLITMSPVASALWGGGSASAFSYKAIENLRGGDIAWYNAQFYDGWGSPTTPFGYDEIVKNGFAPERVIMGLSTNPGDVRFSGHGYVDINITARTLGNLTQKYPTFGGVAGWVYADTLPGGWPKPWIWSQMMAQYLGVCNATQSASKRALKALHFSA